MRIGTRTTAARVWAVGLLTLGCGGDANQAEPAATPEATEGGETAAVHPGPPADWDTMSHEAKGEYMHDVVVPEMKALFQAHDAEEYASFGCKTCHGEDARDVGFEMPNGLPVLDPNQIGEYFGSDDPMAVFMTQTVWPRMAALLGEERYDSETHQGFSCFNCHESLE